MQPRCLLLPGSRHTYSYASCVFSYGRNGTAHRHPWPHAHALNVAPLHAVVERRAGARILRADSSDRVPTVSPFRSGRARRRTCNTALSAAVIIIQARTSIVVASIINSLRPSTSAARNRYAQQTIGRGAGFPSGCNLSLRTSRPATASRIPLRRRMRSLTTLRRGESCGEGKVELSSEMVLPRGA